MAYNHYEHPQPAALVEADEAQYEQHSYGGAGQHAPVAPVEYEDGGEGHAGNGAASYGHSYGYYGYDIAQAYAAGHGTPSPQPGDQGRLEQQHLYPAGAAGNYLHPDMSVAGSTGDPSLPNVGGFEGDPSNVHWMLQEEQRQAQGYPQTLGLPPTGNALYPTYTGDTFIGGHASPFDAPAGRYPPSGSADNIPLLDRDPGAGHHAPGGYLGLAGPAGYGEPVDPNEEESQVRYGLIPQRIPRRLKTIKQVSLFRGNLCLDMPVPKKLLEQCPFTEGEFSRVRYTAATCDPDNFLDEKYALRQVLMDPPRATELMIVMTMYNESEELYTRTMYGVQKNIQHLCTRNRSKMWGKDAWKKVVVVLVSDGRKKINARTLSVLAAQGIYLEGVAKSVVNGKPVTCHIYEYTTQIAVTPDLKYKGAESGIVPVQVIFALKEQNQKKINSHRWFFNSFANCLKPNVCILLDVGTRPGPTSIYHLWKAFDTNSNVGGACGEIVTLKGQYGQQLLNPLVAAQNFEYKMSNILDKPLESIFGYITVLPGAFSAYRWHALQNDPLGNGPLKEYFKGEKLESAVNADLLTKNMYLAEDRVLCWELVSKRQSAWTLHYTKSAYGVTDTPDQVPELISQRRRWLNGSFFAAIHATVKFGYLYRSDHSFLRKFWLHIELVYQLFQQLFAWFSLGNYFIAFSILTRSLEDPSFGITWTKYVNEVLHYIYLGLLVMCFLMAMGNRPQGSKKMFTFAMICFALITAYMTFAAFFIAIKGIINEKNLLDSTGAKFDVGTIFSNAIFRSVILSMLATYGLWLYASLIFFEPWHMFTSFLQYILLSPSYINIINVYAFCNVHDVSWGTKGSTTVSTDLGVVKASGDKKDQVDVDIPKDQKDIDAAYEDAKHVLAQKPPKETKIVDPTQQMEDSYKNIRTNVVLMWAITNGALVAVIIGSGANSSFSANGTEAKVNIYMTILLYCVAGLAFIKAVGATIYMIFWLFQG